MGLCQSEEERNQTKQSRRIDQCLQEAHDIDKKIIKLLLLGAGECGKTTLLKQMRILHSNGFTEAELMQQRPSIYSNTVKAMVEMLRAMHSYKIVFEDPRREEDARVVLQTLERGREAELFSDELALALKRLWADAGINVATYSLRLQFHLHESAKHFFDSLDRISKPGYCPTYEDSLLTRVQTTGITLLDFNVEGEHLRVVDVGGQRSERKKWIHCFENVNALIYISAVSEYDQVLIEDGTTNRLIESLHLFNSICNCRWFIQTAIILFLNKKDVFEEKISYIPITTCFPEYTGPQSYDESIDYIKRRFEEKTDNPEKPIFIHQTCATDTNHVQLILTSVLDMVIQSNMSRACLG